MKAVVFHGVGDIRLEEVNKPSIEDSFDELSGSFLYSAIITNGTNY